MAVFSIYCCRISLGLLLVSTFLPAVCQAVPLSVEIRGVEGELHENIIARLKIALSQDNPDLTGRHIRRLHKHAPEQIKEALAPFGYYSVQVQPFLHEKEKKWKAVYKVDVGPPVLVETVRVKVTGSGREHENFQGLTESFPLRKGDQLEHGKYEAGKKKILHKALIAGYLKTRFTENRVAVRQKDNKAVILLCLETGPLYFFGKTESEQNIITPKLFQQYIPYRIGDVYSFAMLNRLQADLYATGYFSQVTVEPDMSLDDSDNRQIPVEVELAPLKKKNRYSFGIGYGTDTGARGNAGWKNRIINRFGHKPSVNMQLAEKSSRAVAGYEIPVPILDLRYDTLSFDALYSDETWEDTVSRQLSIGTSLKHNSPDYQFGTGMEFLYESYTAGGIDDNTYLLMPEGFFTMILAGERVNTENGLRISAHLKGAVKPVLASTSFFQFQVGGKGILTPLKNWRILGRANFGTTLMESIDELPPSLRFYAGGDHSIRGYGYKELGPTDDSGKVVGGRHLIEASIEVERNLFSIWGVAAFYDMGNAYDDIDAHLYQGAGAGLRITLPFGKIRLDVAEGLSDDSFSPRIHLTLGADL